MYTPPAFEIKQYKDMWEMVRATNVGLLVSLENAKPVANLLPFEVFVDGAKSRLRSHLAKANSQWHGLDGQDVLVVFQGANAYISPRWYATKAEHGKVVPTWNYSMVQVRGRAIVTADPTWLHAQVSRLTDHHERSIGEGENWQVSDAPAEYLQSQLKGIVGLEIEVDSIVGKLKASQNRSAADQKGVVQGLKQKGSMSEMAMAELVARGKT